MPPNHQAREDEADADAVRIARRAQKVHEILHADEDGALTERRHQGQALVEGLDGGKDEKQEDHP
jgi:hypothetical protein